MKPIFVRAATFALFLSVLPIAPARAQEGSGGSGPLILAPQTRLEPAPAEPEPPAAGPLFPRGEETSSAVRTQELKARPGFDEAPVTVGPLGGADGAQASALLPGEKSLGDDLWRGSQLRDVVQLIRDMPVATGSPTMTRLGFRVLRSGAPAPTGPGGPASVLSVRTGRLLAAGDASSVMALTEAEEAWKEPRVARNRAEAALALGEVRQACAVLPALPTDNPASEDSLSAFGLKLGALCQAAAGELAMASLTAQLAAEDGVRDPLFFALIGTAADNTMLEAPDPERLKPLDYELYRLAFRPPPLDAAETAVPALLPRIAQDDALDLRTRLGAAERAVNLGVLDADDLAALYQTWQFSPDEDAAIARGELPSDPVVRRALLYRQALGAPTIAERAEKTRLGLATGEADKLYWASVEAYRPALVALPATPEAERVAPRAADAFITLRERSRASGWYQALAARQPALGRDRREIAALLRISDPNDPLWQSPDFAGALQADLRSANPTAVRFGHVEASLLISLGYGLPPEAWQAFVTVRGVGSAQQPTALDNALAGRLENAAARGAIGETALLSLAALGYGGPEGVSPAVAGRVVSALKEVGLSEEAHMIAFETLRAYAFDKRPPG